MLPHLCLLGLGAFVLAVVGGVWWTGTLVEEETRRQPAVVSELRPPENPIPENPRRTISLPAGGDLRDSRKILHVCVVDEYENPILDADVSVVQAGLSSDRSAYLVAVESWPFVGA